MGIKMKMNDSNCSSISRSHGCLLVLLALLLTSATIRAADPVAEALDTPDWGWGSAGWIIQSAETHDGVDAMQAGSVVLPYASGFLNTTINGPAALTFWWKVSSVTNAGHLQFHVDGQVQTSISGERGWERRSFYLPAGGHTVAWDYYQTSSGAPCKNMGWVDMVSVEIPVAPEILEEPQDVAVIAGRPIILESIVSGTEPLTLQWCYSGVPLENETNQYLSFANSQPYHAGDYSLVASNVLGTVTSRVVHLSVESTVPFFTKQPVSQKAVTGETVTFKTEARGAEPILWQWYFNEMAMAGETNSTLSLTNVPAASDGLYYAVAANGVGAATSQVARLTIVLVPEFTFQPISQGAPEGGSVRFTARVMASDSPQWQWYFNQQPMPGQTNASLLLSNITVLNHGPYYVTASNQYGAATGDVVTLGYSPLIVWGGERYASTSASKAINPLPVSSAATNILSMAAGDDHFLALRDDGSVVSWQDTTGQGGSFEQLIPENTTNVMAISAGSYHSAALLANGEVDLWGLVLGMPIWVDDHPRPDVSAYPRPGEVAAIAQGPGAQHVLYLYRDGSVYDSPHKAYYVDLLTIPPALSNIVSVAAGAEHGIALNANGVLRDWGSGSWRISPSTTNVVAIATGWYHTLVLRADGTLAACFGGYNGSNVSLPPEAVDITAIACGGNHSIALRSDGRLFVWGNNADGQTNVPPWATNITAIAGSSYATMALQGEGAPKISQQPFSPRAVTGDDVRLIGNAVGHMPIHYQWLKDGVPMPGAQKRWLILPKAQPDASSYALVARNQYGAVTSQVAIVTLAPSAPRLTLTNLTFKVPTNGVARIEAGGPGSLPCACQWFFQGTNVLNDGRIEGADTTSLVIHDVTPADLGKYSLIASNTCGAVTSGVFTLAYASATEAFCDGIDSADYKWSVASTNWTWQNSVTQDGIDAVCCSNVADGKSAYFNRDIPTGLQAVYFWWKISSETNADKLRLTVDSTNYATISGEVDWQQRSFLVSRGKSQKLQWTYSKNDAGSSGQDCVWIDQVRFGPPSPPSLTSQPVSARVALGGATMLTASAFGTEPYYFQWLFNGTPIDGATNACLQITNAQASQAGAYCVRVHSAWGHDDSEPALLTVDAAAPTITVEPRAQGGVLQIQWSTGVLESSGSVEGPWATVENATAPLTVEPTAPARFYRVRVP